MNRPKLLLVVVAAVCFVSAADAKTITVPCKKDLSSGQYDWDSSKISENYTFDVIGFREASRDGRFAHGTCTIKLTWSPPD